MGMNASANMTTLPALIFSKGERKKERERTAPPLPPNIVLGSS